MISGSLKVVLLILFAAALYVYIRARGLKVKLRGLISAALPLAMLAAAMVLPRRVFSGLVLSFGFDPSTGLSGRFVTPNGDGFNDFIVFTFENPRDAAIVGKIFDIRGAAVAEMSTHPSLNPRFNRVWDGRSNGVPVKPGLYVYRIEAEEKVFSGTVVVVR